MCVCSVPNFVFPKKLVALFQVQKFPTQCYCLISNLATFYFSSQNPFQMLLSYFLSCFQPSQNLLPCVHTQLVSSLPTFPNVVILFPIVALLFCDATHLVPNIRAFAFALASLYSRVVLHERGTWANTLVIICLCSLFPASFTFTRD